MGDNSATVKPSILHLITGQHDLGSLLNYISRSVTAQDALLFLEQGVYSVADEAHRSVVLDAAPSPSEIYILKEDLVARGLPLPKQSLNLVDYGQFVDLTVRFPLIRNGFG